MQLALASLRNSRRRAPFRFGAALLTLLFSHHLAAAPQAAADELTIAVALPGSGAEQGPIAQAKGLLEGARRAAARINQAGGLQGGFVQVVDFADGCAQPTAIEAAHAILKLHPRLVLGHPCSPAAIAAAREYASSGILFMAIGPRHPLLTEKRAGPTIFRIAARDDRQGLFAGTWLARAFPGATVALISDRTAYSRKLVEAVRAALTAAGSHSSPPLQIVAGEKDYSATIEQLKSLQPAAVYFAGFPIEASIILRAMRKGGLASPVFGADAIATKEFIDAAGPAGAGIRAVRSIHPQSEEDWAILGEAAVNTWEQAVVSASSLNGEQIAQQLASFANASTGEPRNRRERLRALAASGFDAKGDPRGIAFEVIELKDGQFSPAP